jgi:energy-coupling factor transport system substrate-specific component
MTVTTGRSSARIIVWAVALAAIVLALYWFSSQDPKTGVTWSTFSAVTLVTMGAAIGAALATGSELARWTTWESVLAAVLAGVIGVLFWAWSLTVWKVLDVVKNAIPGYGRAIRDLFYGFWFLAAILVPYIVRRPGAALAAEVVAAIISALLGAEWGLTVLISGLVQGGLAEVVFAARGYRHYGIITLVVAAAAAALGSWVVDYVFWYSTLETHILLLMLIARFFSAALFSALLGKWIGDALVSAGVLDNTALGRARLQS